MNRAGIIRSVSMSSPGIGNARPVTCDIFGKVISVGFGPYPNTVRASLTSPVTAAAATITGLMSMVLPVGLP